MIRAWKTVRGHHLVIKEMSFHQCNADTDVRNIAVWIQSRNKWLGYSNKLASLLIHYVTYNSACIWLSTDRAIMCQTTHFQLITCKIYKSSLSLNLDTPVHKSHFFSVSIFIIRILHVSAKLSYRMFITSIEMYSLKTGRPHYKHCWTNLRTFEHILLIPHIFCNQARS